MAATMRIVSLVPSATEIVALLGAAGALVGRSHECDFPDEVQRAPALTGSTISGSTPAEIDAQVRARSGSGTSLYRLDAAQLAALKPDLVITQDLCSVCSIDPASVRAALQTLEPRPAVLSLNPTTIDGVLDDVLRVGEAIGLSTRVGREVVRLRERMNAAAEFVNPYTEGLRVAFLEWTDPLFVGGHWVPQLIERAGGRHPLNPTAARPNTGAAAGPQQSERTAGPSIRVEASALVDSAPEAVIISPCGMDLAGARACVAALAREPWWGDLPAVRARRVALVNGNQMFSRPGPRLVDAFEWLVSWLNGLGSQVARDFPWEAWEGANRAAGCS